MRGRVQKERKKKTMGKMNMTNTNLQNTTKKTEEWAIRVITKLPNTKQSSEGKGKNPKSTNRQNQSTTLKLGKSQWP